MSYHDETLILEEAAALARCGVDCMKSLVDNGEIAATRLNQKHCVLLREDVLDFLRRRGREQAKQRKNASPSPSPDAATPIQRKRGGRRRRPLPRLADTNQGETRS